MANIQPVIRIEINPSNPVPEICAVISSVVVFHPGKENEVLKGIAAAIAKRLENSKEGAKG